jgi:hypothetical protein
MMAKRRNKFKYIRSWLGPIPLINDTDSKAAKIFEWYPILLGYTPTALVDSITYKVKASQ